MFINTSGFHRQVGEGGSIATKIDRVQGFRDTGGGVGSDASGS